MRPTTVKEQLHGIEPSSEFGRMCAARSIRIIAAGSPQAKGRVERAHGTHHDRLVMKLRPASITSYEAANHYLADSYIADHNRRFAREASPSVDFHRQCPSPEQLDRTFCLERERVVAADWVVSYQTRLLQLGP